MTEDMRSAPSRSKRREITEKIVATVIVALVLGILGFCVNGIISNTAQLFKTTTEYAKAVDSIKAGTVVNKEIINGHTTSSGGFAYNPINGSYSYVVGGNSEYVPTKYRLYVLGECVYEGEVCQVEVHFDVDASIYAAYEIGDFFDSEVPIISENGE